MDLKDYRTQIDKIDSELVRLFQERMDVAAQIANYKKEHSLPILQPSREQEKLETLCAQCRGDLQGELQELYSLIFALSRNYQAKSQEGR